MREKISPMAQDNFDSLLHPMHIDTQKSKRRDVIVNMTIPTNLVRVLFDPAIPTSSFNFIQLFLYLFLFVFIALSVIHQCHLTGYTHSTLNEVRVYVHNS